MPDYKLDENLFDVALFLSMMSLCLGVYGQRYKRKSQSGYPIAFGILLFLFSLFGYLDYDFYGYRNIIDNYHRFSDTRHFEAVYHWIFDITQSYMLWRFVIWSLASFMLIYTVKRMRLSYVSTYYFIAVFYAFSFYKMRGSLGMSILFLGLSYLLVYPPHKHLRYIIASVALIVSSYFFHKSMIVAIVPIFVTLFVPLNRKTVIVSLLLFPILVGIVTHFLHEFIMADMVMDNSQMSMTVRSGTNYATNDSVSFNTLGIVRRFISYGPMYLGLYLLTRDIVFRRIRFPHPVRFMFKYWYMMTYIASLFFFQDVSDWMYVRFMTMGVFPMALVLGYYYYIHRYTWMMKLILFVSTFDVAYGICYTLYKRFL